jgi:hypothetical protein
MSAAGNSLAATATLPRRECVTAGGAASSTISLAAPPVAVAPSRLAGALPLEMSASCCACQNQCI